MKLAKNFILSFTVLLALATFGMAQEKTYTIRFNTVAAPEQPQVKAMYKFAEMAAALSGGALDVKVFHSAQLGDQKTSVLAVMRGTLEMTDTAPSWMADIIPYREIGVLEAAYLFRDLDHMYRVMTGPIGQKYWDEVLKRSGMRVLDVWYLGTRELNLAKKVGPVRTPADMKGVKLRMPHAETWLDMGRVLGAEPTPLPFPEVYMALKTGTVDGQDNPLPTVEAVKFYEPTHYIVLTDHQIGVLTQVINEKFWQSLPEKYQEYLIRALRIARNYMNYLVLEREATLLGKFEKEYKMEIIIPDKKAFMENAKVIYKKYDKIWGPGMYEQIQSSE